MCNALGNVCVSLLNLIFSICNMLSPLKSQKFSVQFTFGVKKREARLKAKVQDVSTSLEKRLI